MYNLKEKLHLKTLMNDNMFARPRPTGRVCVTLTHHKKYVPALAMHPKEIHVLSGFVCPVRCIQKNGTEQNTFTGSMRWLPLLKSLY